MDKSKITIKI